MNQDTSTPNHSSTNHKSTLTKPLVSLPVLIGIVVFVGVITFTGGMAFGKDQQSNEKSVSTMNGGDGPSFSTGGGRGMRGGLTGTVGKVTNVSSTSITVENQRNNASTTYKIDSGTKVADGTASVSVSDIKIGDTVMIQASSDDSKSVSRIILNFSPPNGGPSTNSPSEGGSTSSGDNI